MNIDDQICKRRVLAGVPQGSVLGPLLWNLTYDCVLRYQTFAGCNVICYADDTLLYASTPTALESCELANKQLRRLIPFIEDMGLTISENKTEAIIFDRRGIGNPYKIHVGNTWVNVGSQMRYLGIIMDFKLSFLPHFEFVSEKAMKVLRSLTSLMPNLRGPLESKRRLYYNVILSILLYGAPIWHHEFFVSRSKQVPFRGVQRIVASRVVSSYRTVSLDAATLLAGIPPVHLLAQSRSRVFTMTAEMRRENLLTREISNRIKAQEAVQLRENWRSHLQDFRLSGRRTRLAIRSHLDGWLDRGHGSLTYRMTQILTGHGCFNTFLFRI